MKTITSFKISEKWLAGIVILGIGFFFFIHLPVDYDFDGTVFSSYLRYGLIKGNLSEIVQPHHPLYFPVNYLIYKGLHALLGYEVLEYFHLQLFSLCCGLLALWVSFKLIWDGLAALTPKRLFFSVWGIAFIAFSYGFLYYSVEAEVHMGGILFMLWGIYLLFFKENSEGIDDTKTSLGAALCLAIAAGFHLIHGLITISLLLIFLKEHKRFLKVVRFFTFYALFFLGGLTILSLTTGYPLLEHFKNQVAGKDTLAGYRVSYWSGDLSLTSLWESVKATANGLLSFSTGFSMALAIGLLMVMMGIIIWTVMNVKDKTHYFRLGAWLLPYLIFFSFWDHGNMEFKLNILIPFILLFILSMGRCSSPKVLLMEIILGIMVVALLVFNYYGFLSPANNLEINQNFQVAEAVRLNTPANGVIVIGGCGEQVSIMSKIYLPYFGNRRIFILDWMLGHGMSFEQIKNSIREEQRKGNNVYIFTDIVSPTRLTFQQLVKNHHLDEHGFESFLHTLTGGANMVELVAGYTLLMIKTE